MLCFRISLSFLIASAFIASPTLAATLRIGNWNMSNHPNDATDDANLRTVLQHIGSAGGAGGKLDVLAMVETDTDSAPATAAAFGSVYGGNFQSIMTTPDGGGDRTGFVYNASTVQLISQTTVIGITHPAMRAQFRPIGTDGSQDFYMYAVHLQSGTSTTIKNTRVVQAQVLRVDADLLGSANVIFGGDFNHQKADDVSAGVGAFRTFNAAGNGQAFDPVNQVGDWHNNTAFKSVMTNDPATSMDDRFDMQLISSELTDGVGLDYIANSYRVIGNDGSFTLGDTIKTGTGAPSDVLSALAAFSDHLPVVASYSFAVPEPAALLSLAGVAMGMLRRSRERGNRNAA